MRVGRKAEPAKILRDDHPEEFLLLDEIPSLARQVTPFPIDPPVVKHRAKFVDGAVEECLLFRRQRRGRLAEQFRPVGIAGEEVGIPPDVAGLERLALGIRHRRQDAARPGEDRLGDEIAAEAHGGVLLVGAGGAIEAATLTPIYEHSSAMREIRLKLRVQNKTKLIKEMRADNRR